MWIDGPSTLGFFEADLPDVAARPDEGFGHAVSPGGSGFDK